MNRLNFSTDHGSFGIRLTEQTKIILDDTELNVYFGDQLMWTSGVNPNEFRQSLLQQCHVTEEKDVRKYQFYQSGVLFMLILDDKKIILMPSDSKNI